MEEDFVEVSEQDKEWVKANELDDYQESYLGCIIVWSSWLGSFARRISLTKLEDLTDVESE